MKKKKYKNLGYNFHKADIKQMDTPIHKSIR